MFTTLRRTLHALVVLMRWRTVATTVGLLGQNARAGTTNLHPTVQHIQLVPGGMSIDLKLRGGVTSRDLTDAADRIASLYRARRCSVSPGTYGDQATVLLIWHEQPAGTVSEDRKHDLPAGDVWLGTRDDGEPYVVSLYERSLLLGGSPGAGKSVTLRVLLAELAKQHPVALYGIDLKQVELAGFAPRLDGLATTGEDAVKVLVALVGEMDSRYGRMRRNGLTRLEPNGWSPLLVLVVDELAALTGHPEKEVARKSVELLHALISRGRAAGIVIIAATQKPDASAVPTNIRDLFAYRVAHRCGTRQHSDTILGDGWSANGADASRISTRAPGSAWVVDEATGQPMRVQMRWCDEETARSIADRTVGIRPIHAVEVPCIGPGEPSGCA